MSAAGLSIVLPAWNEAAHVEASTRAVIQALAPAGRALQVVLVDDGSTDGTRDIVQRPEFHARRG